MNTFSRIARTGFHTFSISYIIFLLADYVRPGFVSFQFSVHWILLAAAVFGAWWAVLPNQGKPLTPWLRFPVLILLSVLAAVVVWREGEVFGDLRIFLVIVGFLTPWILWRGLSETAEYGSMEGEQEHV